MVLSIDQKRHENHTCTISLKKGLSGRYAFIIIFFLGMHALHNTQCPLMGGSYPSRQPPSPVK